MQDTTIYHQDSDTAAAAAPQPVMPDPYLTADEAGAALGVDWYYDPIKGIVERE